MVLRTSESECNSATATMQVWTIIYDKTGFPDSVRRPRLRRDRSWTPYSSTTPRCPSSISPPAQRSPASIVARMPAVSHLPPFTPSHADPSAKGSLIGSLLPRVLLRKRGVPRDAIALGVTDTGKPYSVSHLPASSLDPSPPSKTTPGLDPPLGFNVTHDEGVVAMAFGTGDLGPPAYNIGVDIMQLKVPPRITFAEFVDSVSSQARPLPPSASLTHVCTPAHPSRTGSPARRHSRTRSNPPLLLGMDAQGGVHKSPRHRARF